MCGTRKNSRIASLKIRSQAVQAQYKQLFVFTFRKKIGSIKIVTTVHYLPIRKIYQNLRLREIN